jgi:hypothetical protein
MSPEHQAAPRTPFATTAAGGDITDQRLGRARWWLALSGLLAGLVAFGAGEAVYDLIPAERVGINTMGQIVIAPTARTAMLANTRNAALTFGVLGLCLGGILGIAGGLARPSARAMVAAGLAGSIVGLAAGAGVSLAMLPVFWRAQSEHPEIDLIFSTLMHGSIWGVAGAVAGLAFAFGFGKPRLHGRALEAGFLGAVLGAIAFDLSGALLFPLASTGEPVSTTWPTRLLARLLVSVATAALIILVLPRPSPVRAARDPEVAPPNEP